ncbi:dihydrolipoamide acetyltransferase family protein [Rhodoglobus vestalii]|uniref:dihydrolipoamide acetyltransferase family protein n=1 Tax=Rhodoglobus vestalii TaxID=193384 RepID=UPI001C02A5FD|nr:dihydrolipoamide acetyltransferase family protein [Rhodoglobus vestalii]
MTEAVESAETSPDPSVDELFDKVYSSPAANASTWLPSEPEPKPDPGAESESTAKKASPASAESASTVDKLRISPLARKLAHDNDNDIDIDIDLDSVTGSGPNGRIIRVDVDAAIAAAAEVIPLSKIRKVTAKRLTQSQDIPHFFLTNGVEVDRLMVLRREVNEGLATQGVKVSLNDFIVKAVAFTLRQHPEANVSFNGDSLLRHPRINVGIAVVTDAGLLVPVVTDADRKSLSEIGAEVVALASAARGSKLTLDQMSGGTFSVSNLGMFGIDEFTAMLNAPEAGILAVGAASPELKLLGGELVEVQKMKITLTVDHRGSPCDGWCDSGRLPA